MDIPSAVNAAIPLVAGVFATVIGFSKRYDDPKWRPMRRVRWLGPVLVAFSVFLYLTRPATPPRIDISNLDALASEIRMKAKLPQQVDEYTTFTDVRPAGEKRIGFYFTLKTLPHDSSEVPLLMQRMETSLRGNACNDPNYLAFFKQGLELSISYTGNDGILVKEMLFTPADCKL